MSTAHQAQRRNLMSAIHRAQWRTMGTVAPSPLDNCVKQHQSSTPSRQRASGSLTGTANLGISEAL